MKLKVIALVLVLLSTTIALPVAPATAGNEDPLAEAGLDQDVSRGATVLLDATESRDPDGTIEQYAWSIRTPDGRVISPECPDCARTQFVPTEIGVYDVTVTVTDDDGATSSDTLYVDVSPGASPQVSVSGPSNPTVGQTVTYTASIEAGTANLAEVRWFVDGTQVATHEIAGRSQTDTLSRTFPTTDEHIITVTAFDEDDQNASDSQPVHVEPSANDGGQTLASQASPTIHGPRTVLGEPPLRGSYTASLDLGPENVESVEWYTVSGAIGSDTAEAVTWTPGDHQLFAIVTYTDDSTNVARFPDGTTAVIADPEPTVSLGNISRYAEIAGRATASDGYANLQSLTVFVDGERIARTEVDDLQLRKRGGAEQLSTSYSFEEITPGEPHTVRVVGTDVRGQSAEQTRTVTPTGEPEIVRAEFVNDPVDSYHERINASRYAAHHVLEIDLNGVDPDNIVVEGVVRKEGGLEIDDPDIGFSKGRQTKSGILKIHSYWSGKLPKEYKVFFKTSYYPGAESKWVASPNSTFMVEPSHPELRYEVISGGRVDYMPDWGLVVDASESFDPDGTSLDYYWGVGNDIHKTNNSIGKFSSFQGGKLTIQDGYDLNTTNHESFLHYFNPGVNRTDELTTGPYKPNETVRLRVFSRTYKLSKNRYDVNLGLAVPHPEGRVNDWQEVRIDNGECVSGPCDHPIQVANQLDIDNRRYRYYVGTVEIPASAFANGTYDPTVLTYNEEHPAQTELEHDLPNVNVLTKGSRYWENVTITNLEYTVEKPDYIWKIVSNESIRDEYLADNYTIAYTDSTLNYVIEHRMQTQDAVFETEYLSFQESGTRETFLAENPDWYNAGTNTTTRTYTTTETEWRDSQSGNGTYTGNMREKLVKAAQYKLERKYRYEYQVEKTGTKTVTRTKYRWVQKTGTKTVIRCNDYIGCYEATETYTYWTKEPYTYTTTKTYTYYETKTDTYWAAGKRHPDHEYTGESRQVQISAAEYRTQYEYEYDVEHTRTVYQYLVERQVKIQPATYEWQEYAVVSDKLAAQTMANRGSDWRVGDTRTSPQWTLKKFNGTRTEIVGSIESEADVTETRAMVTGTLNQKYIDMKNGNVIVETIGTEQTTFTANYALSKDEIKDELLNDDGTERDIDWCEMKQICES